MKIKVLALALVALSFMACSNSGATREALEVNGYTDIQILGPSIFHTGEEDWATKFEATSPAGFRVRGYVTGDYISIFRGATIRLTGKVK